MHAYCLHWLISTGLLFQSAFCHPCKLMTEQMMPIATEGSDLAVGLDIAPTVSTHLSKPCSEYRPIVGTCKHHGHSKLCHLCCLASLF